MLQGLRGLCRGWQAGGSGQGWGAQLPPPTLGPGAWSELASLLSSGDGSTWLRAIPGPTAQAPKPYTGPTVCWAWGDAAPKSCTEGPVAALTLQGVGRDLPAQHNPHPRKRQADVREGDGIGVSRGGSVGFNI